MHYKYKVCVYAIAKNEAKQVDRFCEAVKDADYIAVLDTGSTDDTVEKLNAHGVINKQEVITPWRFDDARNKSMELIPKDTDICICMDLDDIAQPGWRDVLEKEWNPEATIGSYTYVWSRTESGQPLCSFSRPHIHGYKAVEWKYPIHEVPIDTSMTSIRCDIPSLKVEHHPDSSKSRSSYLPLLVAACEENPQDSRLSYYLGREYYYVGQYDKAIEELKRYLSLPSSTWNVERSSAAKHIALCYLELRQNDAAQEWGLRAIAECTDSREAWYTMENISYYRQDWDSVIYYGNKAIHCDNNVDSSFSIESYGAEPYDLLSLGYYHKGDLVKAFGLSQKAAVYSPSDTRLQNNVKAIVRALVPKAPRLSFIIPVYNASLHLRQCIDSLCVQTLPDIEMIFVDDGSTDESLAMLNTVAQLDPRIQVYKQDHKGVACARNLGLEMAHGKYISFVDADDYVSPTLANETVLISDKEDLEMCLFDYEIFYIDEKNKQKVPANGRGFLYPGSTPLPKNKVFSFCDTSLVKTWGGTTTFIWDGVYRRDKLIEFGIKFPDIPLGEDSLVKYKLYSMVERAYILPQVLYYYRLWNSAASSYKSTDSRGREAQLKLLISNIEQMRSMKKVLSDTILYKYYIPRFMQDVLLYVNYNYYIRWLLRNIYRQELRLDNLTRYELDTPYEWLIPVLNEKDKEL